MSEQRCPACHKKFDGHISVEKDGATPSEGDYSICFGCFAILSFDAELNLVLADSKEIPQETFLHKAFIQKCKKLYDKSRQS